MGTKEILRAVVIGCGKIVESHILSIRKTRHIKLVAVCDVNETLVRQTAKRFNISTYYNDFSELLSKERVDVVHITTPPQTHLALSTQAMEAGCHVLVEKPMALNLSEADRMIEAARINGVSLCVTHNMLFGPMIIKAKSMIKRGVIGDIVGMSIINSIPVMDDLMLNKAHWCHKLPGGIFGEMLPHPIYLATAFLGRLEVAAVYNHRLSSDRWLVADELRVTLRGERSIATITASVSGRGDVMALDIFGTKASLRVSNGVVVRRIPKQNSRPSRGLDNIWTASQLLTGTALTTLNVILGRFHDGHYTLIQRFTESLQNGTKPPVTEEEAREVMRLYQAITSQI